MQKISQRKIKKAFSLIELMLAALFLVTVFIAVLSSLIASSLSNEAYRNLSIATMHAQNVLEKITDQAKSNFSSIVIGSSQCNRSCILNNGDPVVLNNELIDTTITEATLYGAPTLLLLDVVITVTWQNRGGRNASVVLETWVTHP